MFTRVINTIRETITRTPNDKCHSDYGSEYSSDSRRASLADELPPRASVTEEAQNYSLRRRHSILEPISISTAERAPNKRRSSLFGISNVTYDDYVQKDLVSSSWT